MFFLIVLISVNPVRRTAKDQRKGRAGVLTDRAFMEILLGKTLFGGKVAAYLKKSEYICSDIHLLDF